MKPDTYMTAAEIRTAFLKFFESKGHPIVASSPVIPQDDPTLLFTNAGMNQFKDNFLGLDKSLKRATTAQKCIRAGGKHNDLDNVGYTARHHTFFEMLGNFSFGDYFKREAIAWAWELLTQVYKLPAERLWVTVYIEDDEAYDIWNKEIGVPAERIVRIGDNKGARYMSDNFWMMGDTGPCGPCSEIFFDRGPKIQGGPPGSPDEDGDRYMEIWNLVFTQFNRDTAGNMNRLPKPNIDTGMGLERLASVLQEVDTNYDIDLFQNLMRAAKEAVEAAGAENVDPQSPSLKVIADHIRSCGFAVADGVKPGNEGRAYVIRRICRRAIRHGYKLGARGLFFYKLIEPLAREMGDIYPEIKNPKIAEVIRAEEERFLQTLSNGMQILDEAMAECKDGVLPGDIAFKLHDTFGFPIDLTVEIAGTAGHDVDMDGFTACMEDQKARARANAKGDAWGSFNDVWVELSDKVAASEFDGYDNDVIEGAKVVAIVRNGESVESAAAGEDVEVVLDRTPFYAEMGGQQGDAGKLSAEGVVLTVADTKNHNGLYAHVAHVADGTLTVGAAVTAALDAERRGFLRRNHTATHLLDAALKQVLGEHVSQAGSLVTPEHLRFDFTHFEALSSEQLKAVEDLVNQQIFASKPVVTRVMGIDEAKAAGAVALFGEKYGDVVRVVSVGAEDQPFSRELCGGTHAANTAEIGLFKIISESSTGSNVRRIEAVTSKGALDYMADRLALVDAAAAALKCRVDEVPARVENLQAELRETSNKLKKALTGGSSDAISSAIEGAVELDGYKLVVAELQGLEAADLRNVWDTVHQKVAGPVACVVASVTEKGTPALLAAGSDDAVKAGFHAGNVIKQIAGLVDGRGGGRPNMAQAGGKNAAGIADALAAAKTALGA